jgi:hypothetical protein
MRNLFWVVCLTLVLLMFPLLGPGILVVAMLMVIAKSLFK